MIICAAFATRLMTLVLIALVTSSWENIEFENSNLTFINASAQICIATAALLIYNFCSFIIKSIRRADAYNEMPNNAIDDKETEVTIKFKPTELRNYVIHVHMSGFLLWATVSCFTFNDRRMLHMFCVGFSLGLIIHSAARLREKRQTWALYVVYFILTIPILILLLQNNTYNYSEIILFFNISFVGFLWGYQDQFDDVLQTCVNAIPTCFLISAPICFLYSDNLAFFHSKAASVHVYFFMVGPLLKFMGIFVLAISIQTGKKMEFLICVVLALALQHEVTFHDNEYLETFRRVLAVMLLSFHSIRLILEIVIVKHPKILTSDLEEEDELEK